MRKSAVLFIVVSIGLLMLGCQKDISINKPGTNTNPVPPTNYVKLNFSLTENKSGEKGLIVSGQNVSGDINYHFSFWLDPATGASIASGIYTIKNESDAIVYQSSSPENGIDHRFINTGTYSMEVIGNYQGIAFSFVNITIIVHGGGTNPSVPATAPVRLYDFEINGSDASVSVAISKNEYSQASNWFHVKRINGANFQTNLGVLTEIDSVRFILTFPAINQTYVEFNTGYHGGTGDMWLTPSAGYPPSILYCGYQNTPYDYSGSYFGFRLHVNGTEAELRTYGGALILSTGGTTPTVIPGNAGDGVANNYQVRWSGYTHYIKTTATNPTFRYKIGIQTWTHLPTTQLQSNNEYFFVEIPSSIGELRFQYGVGTGTSFTPASSMANSMYYETSTGELVKNL